MDKMLFVVESNCADPAREDEFNEWYNNTHLPDVFENPRVLRAVRYERMNSSEGQTKYLAIYEIETDDIQALAKGIVEEVERRVAEGLYSDLLQLTSSGTFKQIYSLSK